MKNNKTKLAVCTLLKERSPAAYLAFQTHCVLPHDLSEPDSIRRINQYLRDVLGRLPRDTMEARTYLVDDCSLTEWLSLLDRGVVPELRS